MNQIIFINTRLILILITLSENRQSFSFTFNSCILLFCVKNPDRLKTIPCENDFLKFLNFEQTL